MWCFVARAAAWQVEQFFMEVMKIPNYPQRLECWMYKMKFHNQVSQSRKPRTAPLQACSITSSFAVAV
jgi:hypothetical protein